VGACPEKNRMYTFLSILYVLVCLFLILVVLLQPGRGGVGGAFGGGSSQTVFGSSGAGNFLTRLTSISAALFMILSATLAYMSSSSDKSLEAATQAARAKAAQKAKVTADAGVSAPTPVQVDMRPADQEPIEEAPEGPQQAPTLEQIVPPAPAGETTNPPTK
jgi:preprotein translocase subunit SecG